MKEEINKFMNEKEVKKRMDELIDNGKRLNVNIDEVRKKSPRLAAFIVRTPIEAIKMFEDQLNSYIKDQKPPQGKGDSKNQQD